MHTPDFFWAWPCIQSKKMMDAQGGEAVTQGWVVVGMVGLDGGGYAGG